MTYDLKSSYYLEFKSIFYTNPDEQSKISLIRQSSIKCL